LGTLRRRGTASEVSRRPSVIARGVSWPFDEHRVSPVTSQQPPHRRCGNICNERWLMKPPPGPGGTTRNRPQPGAKRTCKRKTEAPPVGGNRLGSLQEPAAGSQCRRQWPRAGTQGGKQRDATVGRSVAKVLRAKRRSQSATAGAGVAGNDHCVTRLLGRHVSLQEGQGLIEREGLGVVVARLRFRRQNVLRLVNRQFQRLAR